MQYFIYKIINKNNGNFYIGSTTNFKRRKEKHLTDLKHNRHHSFHLQKAYNMYGADSFEFIEKEIHVNSEEELRMLEERYINFCWKSGKLYNVSKKGSGGDLVSYHPKNAEIRKKQSILLKERYNRMTEEEKQLKSENLKGEKNPNFGNRWNDEQKLHNSIKLKEYYKTHTNYINGKTFEEVFGEERAKEMKKHLSKIISEKNIGENNPFFGQHHTEETKKHLSKIKRGKPNLYSSKKVLYNGEIFDSASDCAKKLSIPMVTIAYRCRKQIYGFSYADDKQNPREAKNMYNFELCEKIAQTCKTKKELEKLNVSVYDWLIRHNKMAEIAEKYFIEMRHRWSKEEIIVLAKKYSNYSEFRRKETNAVNSMRQNGWTDEIKSVWL